MLRAIYHDPSLIGIYADWLEEHGMDNSLELAIAELLSLGCPKVWVAIRPDILTGIFDCVIETEQFIV
jgi:hypothetical protein